MPRKNSVKRYFGNGFYHIYNRGVDGRDIFVDNDDYLCFLHILKTTLSPAPEKGSTLVSWPQKNFFGKLDLLAYCLMPNHFHLMIRQTKPTIISEFVRSLCTRYGMYFNKRHGRFGSLFQGIFKAVDIDNENYLLWVNRYIHRNPANFQNYPYSSLANYLGQRNATWLNTKIILDCFSASNQRQRKNFLDFIDEENAQNPIDLEYLLLDVDD